MPTISVFQCERECLPPQSGIRVHRIDDLKMLHRDASGLNPVTWLKKNKNKKRGMAYMGRAQRASQPHS